MRALGSFVVLLFCATGCRCGSPPLTEVPDAAVAIVAPPMKQVVSTSGQMQGANGLTLDVQVGGAVGRGPPPPLKSNSVTPEAAVRH